MRHHDNYPYSALCVTCVLASGSPEIRDMADAASKHAAVHPIARLKKSVI